MKSINNFLKTIISLNEGYLELDLFLSIVIQQYYKNISSVNNDFITGPEISQLFGEIIALYLIKQMNLSPKSQYNKSKSEDNQKIAIIEIGPGNGTLISDILRTFSYFPREFQKIQQIFLIEVSDSLIATQKMTLSKFFHNSLYSDSYTLAENKKIIWYKSLQEATMHIQKECEVYIISNELFDALPIKQFVLQKDLLSEIIVSNRLEIEQNQFEGDISKSHIFKSQFAMEQKILSSMTLFPTVECIINFPWLNKSNNLRSEGICEFSPSALQLCDDIAALLKTHGGLSLIIDYGYDQPIYTSSLQAIYKQQKLTNIFDNLGLADISALVNFPSLEHRFKQHGLLTILQNQKDFLQKNGIDQRAQQLKKKYSMYKSQMNNSNINIDNNYMSNIDSVFYIEWQLNKLLNEMGTLFKVLEVTIDTEK